MTLYLDHAASTLPLKEVLEGLPSVALRFGNPSSVHERGREARSILDDARVGCATIFDVGVDQVIFTSGATESVHLGMIGGYLTLPEPKKKILLSPLAHACMFGAAEFLAHHHNVEINYLPLDEQGFFDLDKITAEYLENFDLVAVEHGNSEIGLLQPVEALGALVKELEHPPIFAVDTAASVVTEEVSLASFNADVLIFSGEKFGGLKGTGMILKSPRVGLEPLFRGTQEFDQRGGTENVLGIWAFGQALKLHTERRQKARESYLELHTFLREAFIKTFPALSITTPGKNFLPHIFHVRLPEGISGHEFVVRCDLEELCLSSGSACSSGSVGASKVLSNLGLSEEEAARGVRISFGRETKKEDVASAFKVIEKIMQG